MFSPLDLFMHSSLSHSMQSPLSMHSPLRIYMHSPLSLFMHWLTLFLISHARRVFDIVHDSGKLCHFMFILQNTCGFFCLISSSFFFFLFWPRFHAGRQRDAPGPSFQHIVKQQLWEPTVTYRLHKHSASRTGEGVSLQQIFMSPSAY